MTTEAMEERILALEAEVARIKAQLRGERYGVIGRTNPQMIAAILSKEPPSEYADTVWRRIEAEREQERAEARRLAEMDEAA
jgi:hypothetical protein